MKIPELLIIFGLIAIIFVSGSSFLYSFNLEQPLPEDISKAFNSTYQQIESAKNTVQQNVNTIQQGGPMAILGAFGLAFSGIYFIIATLFTVLVSIPQAVIGAFSYLGNVLGIASTIVYFFIAVVVGLLILKIIEFITGRQFT